MIEIKNLEKKYGNLVVLKDINLKINKNEFITIFGPNGCGKSTLLNIISGLETYNGLIKKDENLKFSFVFQNYSESLLPWKNVYDNINLNCVNNTKALDLLKTLGLVEYENFYPYQLSGGLQQKVAIARAFLNNPNIIFLDEPFSSLDYSTSRTLMLELMNLWERERKTVVFVSHDIDEAIMLADRVIILSNKPSKIKGEIRVNLPRPRNLKLLNDNKFLRIKNKVLKLI
ncbi:ABC transporter ATP-binding protein [Candidatus Woesearchaeota archaeon]|nr:ABC transporter ATP-binding protein [Candidatus Woesearchaeota archaeon]